MPVVGSLHSAVHHHVAVFVFDSEASGGVARFLPAVVVHGLDGAVGVLPPLVVGRVDLPLARVEVDLLGAVPGRAVQAEAGGDESVLISDKGCCTHGLTCMTVPSVSTLSSLPPGKRFFTVWSGKVISLRPSGKCFSVVGDEQS